jgi:hypothetical protein
MSVDTAAEMAVRDAVRLIVHSGRSFSLRALGETMITEADLI